MSTKRGKFFYRCQSSRDSRGSIGRTKGTKCSSPFILFVVKLLLLIFLIIIIIVIIVIIAALFSPSQTPVCSHRVATRPQPAAKASITLCSSLCQGARVRALHLTRSHPSPLPAHRQSERSKQASKQKKKRKQRQL
jgi:hypothetical protein